MRSVDGDVRLSVSLDASDVEKDAAQLKREIDKIFNSKSSSPKFESLKNQMKQTYTQATELMNKMNSLKNTQVPTSQYAGLQKSLQRASNQFDTLLAKQERMQAKGQTSGKSWNSLQTKMEKISDTIGTIKYQMKDLQMQGKAFTAGADTDAYKKLSANLDKANDKMRLLIKRQQELAQTAGTNGTDRVTKSMNGLHKATGHARMSLAKMLGMSLLMSIAFRVLSAIMNGMMVGFQNLSQYSNQTNADISALKSSLIQLQNSFATAFAPILTVVTPLLTHLMNMLSKALSYIGMFMAALTGRKSFVRAKKVQTNYAAGLAKSTKATNGAAKATRGAAKATKEATKANKTYLSGLDEITRFESDKDTSSPGGGSPGGGGGGGGGIGGGGGPAIGDMFEEVAIPSKFTEMAEAVKTALQPIIDIFKEFGQKIKTITVEWWNSLNWEPLKTAINDLLLAFAPLLEILLNGLAWAYEHVLLPLATWTIEKGLPALIEALAKAFKLVTIILQELKPIFMFIWKEILVPFGKTVEIVADDIIQAFLGILDFLIGVFTKDSEMAFDALKQIVKAFYDAIAAIFKLIQDVVLKPFDRFLTSVFTADWSKAFGIVGDIINGFMRTVNSVYQGIKTSLGGLITFISGVFTGNWRKAWSGVKQIFKGMFDSLVGVVKTPVNLIIGALNGLISGTAAAVNAVIKTINKINFTVPDWVPKYGGKHLGFNVNSVHATKIPFLARGAVIPPNAPFMAMLGDQKNGTNIEAPLDTIKQAVAEVLGNNQGSGGSYKFVAQLNRRTLFEQVIEEAQLRRASTGLNPFLI